MSSRESCVDSNVQSLATIVCLMLAVFGIISRSLSAANDPPKYRWNGVIQWNQPDRLDFTVISQKGETETVEVMMKDGVFHATARYVWMPRSKASAISEMTIFPKGFVLHDRAHGNIKLQLLTRDGETGRTVWLYPGFGQAKQIDTAPAAVGEKGGVKYALL